MKPNVIAAILICLAVATAGCTSLATNPFAGDGDADCPETSAGGGGAAGSGSGMEPAGHASAGDTDCIRINFQCGDGDVVPPAEGTEVGAFRFRVTNEDDTTSATMCVQDDDGTILDRRTVQFKGGTESVVDLQAPLGNYRAAFEQSESGSSATIVAKADLSDCDDGVFEFRVLMESSSGASLKGTSHGCVSDSNYPQTADGQAANEQAAVPFDIGSGGPGSVVLAMSGLAIIGLGALVWRWESTRLVLAGLFTRLTRSRVLDQATRSQIDECVRAEPGVHANEIAKRLDLGHGQARYHLGVLAREKVLACVRHGGRRHYFPFGMYGPDEMRAQAALRSDAAARVYEAVRAAPGRSLQQVAEAAGVSESFASRLIRSLEDVDLVRRDREGRQLRLEPTDDAPV